jgi:pre-rRNA-processing protein TSR4
MIKNSKKGIDIDNYFISLGFADMPQKNDFDYQKFPSKLGGEPIWLIPLSEDKYIDLSFFECNFCNKQMYFLLQIYCPLEDNKNSFHRMLYIFFCKECWKKQNAVKVLRVQLEEISKYYEGENLLNRQALDKDELIAIVNKKIKKVLPEYLIDTLQEREEASRLYINFYDKLDEKSMDSKKSRKNSEMDVDEEDLASELIPDIKNDEIDKMIKNYYIEEGNNTNTNEYSEIESYYENEMISKLQKDIFQSSEDVFYDLFSKVCSYDPKQILRYCRDDVLPLWFNNKGLLTMKNKRCKYCEGEMIFEFQV